MVAMDLVSDSRVPLVPGGRAERAYDGGVVEEAVVFQATRSGMLNTSAGAARVALRLQLQRCAGGRLVAVMVAAGLTEHGRWTLRRIAVFAEAGRSAEAARVLGSLLPDLLTDVPDGTVMLTGKDGLVLAEVLSRSGRLARTEKVEVDMRRTEPQMQPAMERQLPMDRWFSHLRRSARITVPLWPHRKVQERRAAEL